MENFFKKFYCWNKKILSKKWKILLFNLKIWFKNIQDFICQQEAHGLKVWHQQIKNMINLLRQSTPPGQGSQLEPSESCPVGMVMATRWWKWIIYVGTFEGGPRRWLCQWVWRSNSSWNGNESFVLSNGFPTVLEPWRSKRSWNENESYIQ